MAFGTGTRSFGPNAVIYSFKIKTKDLPAPIFEVSKKGTDGKYAVVSKNTTRVSGHLISASPRENTHQGKVIKSLNLTLQDGDDVYFVSVGYTFIGRNLFNSLLALKVFDEVEISLYQSKPKPGSGHATGFASVCLRQGGEVVRGLFDSKTELPQTKKIRVNGADVTETSELDAFLEAKVKAFCKVVNAASPKQEAVAAAHNTSDDTNVDAEDPVAAGAGEEPEGRPF